MPIIPLQPIHDMTRLGFQLGSIRQRVVRFSSFFDSFAVLGPVAMQNGILLTNRSRRVRGQQEFSNGCSALGRRNLTFNIQLTDQSQSPPILLAFPKQDVCLNLCHKINAIKWA
jgi:hypothetical protein